MFAVGKMRSFQISFIFISFFNEKTSVQVLDPFSQFAVDRRIVGQVGDADKWKNQKLGAKIASEKNSSQEM